MLEIALQISTVRWTSRKTVLGPMVIDVGKNVGLHIRIAELYNVDHRCWQGCGNSLMVDVSIGVNILEGNMQCLVKLHRF